TRGWKKMTILLLLPLTLLLADYRSYGNEIFRLTASPGQESLGLLSGLVYQGSENVQMNPLALKSLTGQNTYISHSIWFASSLSATSVAYSFDLNEKQSIGFMLSKISAGNIQDSRAALLDYGSDGIPSTLDEDGSENNGKLDPGERLDFDRISIHSLNNYALTVSFPYTIKKFTFGVSSRIMVQDLLISTGYGLSFDLYFQKKWKYFHHLTKIANLPSAITFFDNGKREAYAPYLQTAAMIPLSFSIFTIQPGFLLNYYPAEKHLVNQTDNSISSIFLIPAVNLFISKHFSAACSYSEMEGLKLASEIVLPSFSLQYAWRGQQESALGMTHLFALKFSLAELLED
ncbi:MAG: hypothetical protein KAI81_07565, partial [Candidatus Marinimicrobia bacterium]|nr:hypothetical protein [Candidatus Neomarinimicrobiota bacterium]